MGLAIYCVCVCVYECGIVDNLGIFDDMKQNNTKTLETLKTLAIPLQGHLP